MADPVVINFAGPPVAKGRPRFTSIGGRPIAYTPTKTRKYESALQYAAQQAMDGRPLLVGALSMSVVVSLPVPQSWSGKKQKQALAGEIMPTKRPDLGNYVKAAEDALNGVVFLDDSQVTFQTASKIYAEKPGLRIEVASYAREEAP